MRHGKLQNSYPSHYGSAGLGLATRNNGNGFQKNKKEGEGLLNIKGQLPKEEFALSSHDDDIQLFIIIPIIKKMANTVILADDHILLRNALGSLINNFADFRVINLANDGTELMKMVTEGPAPDIVILDLNMPKMDGYDTARWLHDTHPEIKILILTMYDSEVALIRLLQVGVRGFLKKDIHPDELREALMSIARDGFYYSHQTTGKLGSLFRKSNEKNSSVEKAMLSEIEIDFLKFASTELTYKEIAAKMKLTPRIIDNYRDTLFEKLDIKSRVGLAIYAVKNGVVTF